MENNKNEVEFYDGTKLEFVSEKELTEYLCDNMDKIRRFKRAPWTDYAVHASKKDSSVWKIKKSAIPKNGRQTIN